MYCGYYGEIDGKQDDTFFYIGINFHWRGHYLGLPQLPKGKAWVPYTDTELPEQSADSAEETVRAAEDETAEAVQEIYVSPRSIAVYMAKECPPVSKQRKRVHE